MEKELWMVSDDTIEDVLERLNRLLRDAAPIIYTRQHLEEAHRDGKDEDVLLEALGVLASKYAEWDPNKCARVAYAMFEDSNVSEIAGLFYDICEHGHDIDTVKVSSEPEADIEDEHDDALDQLAEVAGPRYIRQFIPIYDEQAAKEEDESELLAELASVTARAKSISRLLGE